MSNAKIRLFLGKICILLCLSMGTAFAKKISSRFTLTPLGSQIYDTIYIGESKSYPVSLEYEYLAGEKIWNLDTGFELQAISGSCPNIPVDYQEYKHGKCEMVVKATGHTLGNTMQGTLQYTNNHVENRTQLVFSKIAIATIPHDLSMSPIPEQKGTAGTDFYFSFKNYINYYNENAQYGTPAQGSVSPTQQDGLRFDPNQLAIVGKPTRLGTYIFNISAYNSRSQAVATRLMIDVKVNLKDKPVFRKQYTIASAMPEQYYKINLLDLLETNNDFMISNEIHFEIDDQKAHPDWIKISENEPIFLEGLTPKIEPGQEVSITLIAHSNTGGASESTTINIPIAYDPSKKPVINPLTLDAAAGSNFSVDLMEHIQNIFDDSEVKLILDKVEPVANWLHVSSNYPTTLEGMIPLDATGKLYKVTLRANTSVGGSSEPVTFPLQINIDPSRTPRFKASKPFFPLMYPGNTYQYNFADNGDIFPEYSDIPYTIQFAEDKSHPFWVKIEDNTIIADVPKDIEEDFTVWVVIRNTPGGQSPPIQLDFVVMH